jgi:hypothetical protein
MPQVWRVMDIKQLQSLRFQVAIIVRRTWNGTRRTHMTLHTQRVSGGICDDHVTLPGLA